MEFSYSQTENFEMEKLSSDTGYFKKPVEINREKVRLSNIITDHPDFDRIEGAGGQRRRAALLLAVSIFQTLRHPCHG